MKALFGILVTVGILPFALGMWSTYEECWPQWPTCESDIGGFVMVLTSGIAAAMWIYAMHKQSR